MYAALKEVKCRSPDTFFSFSVSDLGRVKVRNVIVVVIVLKHSPLCRYTLMNGRVTLFSTQRILYQLHGNRLGMESYSRILLGTAFKHGV